MGVSSSNPEVKGEDIVWMRRALILADRAAALDEVPIGAVLVCDGVEVGSGWNTPISQNDPTAHAEINALRVAAGVQGNYRLPGSTLYVTVEPCVMCAGAIINARVQRLVFGAHEPKTGAAGSVFDIIGANGNFHQLSCTSGVLAEEAGHKLQQFFRAKRERS